MEFTNEIFFNKKLTQNETVLITYSGKLYKEYSAEITIVYGFGEKWDYTQETKMQEKENGFEAAITMKNYDTFNFCFRNNYNIWDNNSGFNYIATIEPAKTEETINQETPTTNDNLSEDTNTVITENTDTPELSEEAKQAAIEQAFDDLLNSIMDFEEEDINKDVNLEKGFGLQSVDEIKENDFTSCDDIFEQLYNELAKNDSEEEKTNIQTASSTETETSTSQLEDLLSGISEQQEPEDNLITAKELNELMDNILNSIIEEDNNKETNINTSTENEVYGLPAKKEVSSLENTIDNWIDGAYAFIRNVWTGIKKVGVLIKQKAQELLGEEDK